MKRALLILAVVVHLGMLASILDHFQWGGEAGLIQPVRKEASPVRGLLPRAERGPPESWSWWTRRHHQEKQANLRTTPLQAIPPRRTTNRWLDRWVRDLCRTDPGGDFFQLYAAGVALREGVSIFEEPMPGTDPEALARVRSSAPFHPPNRYPPVVITTLGRLLARLEVWNAYAFWLLVHEIAWIWLLAWGAGLAPPGHKTTVWILGLAFLPWYAELYMGQTTFIVCWSVVAAIHLLRRGRRHLAAAAWALGLAVKPLGLLLTPVLMGPLGWLRVAAAVGLPALGSLPYFLGRPEEARLFLGWAFGQELPVGVGSCSAQNLLHHLLYWPPSVPILTAGVILLSLLATLRSSGRLEERVALWLLAYLLVYAHVWEHHFILLVPVMILLVAAGRIRLAVGLFAGAGLPSLYWLVGDGLSWGRETVYLLWKALPVMVVYGILLKGLLPRGSRR